MIAMAERGALTPDGEERLDAAILKYLRRELRPIKPWDLYAYAEIHSNEEIDASISRLVARGLAEQTSKGAFWPITTEDECRACEALRTTYQNPRNERHTCGAATGSRGTGTGERT